MPERTLVLLRHGKSDWSGDEPDVDRPLAPRGRRQAPEAGRWLERRLAPPDLAVVSPARRARDTWALAGAELTVPPHVRVEDTVYAAGVGDLLQVVAGLPDDVRTVVLVGHNPGLEELAHVVTGTWVPMPTSALAVIDLAGPWSEVRRSASLRAAGRPPAG